MKNIVFFSSVSSFSFGYYWCVLFSSSLPNNKCVHRSSKQKQMNGYSIRTSTSEWTIFSSLFFFCQDYYYSILWFCCDCIFHKCVILWCFIKCALNCIEHSILEWDDDEWEWNGCNIVCVWVRNMRRNRVNLRAAAAVEATALLENAWIILIGWFSLSPPPVIVEHL